MQKFIISGAASISNVIGNAISKAPKDICTILSKKGYHPLYLTVDQKENAIKRLILKWWEMVVLSKKVPQNSIIIVQYPLCYLLWLAMPFYKKCKTRTLIIHDLDSIRVKGKISWLEKKNINSFDKIIVHTQEMKSFLSNYVKKPMIVLECFDYLLDEDTNNIYPKRLNSYNICFAGNISKSKWLIPFVKECDYFHLFLYGIMNNDMPNGNYTYMGCFSPDKIGILEGSWGIVWDGDSIDYASGSWGDYLRIIASHKISLYIVAGLPLIVWSNSAMAKFVTKYNIGICVNSLRELKDAITKISDEEYFLFLTNIKKIASDLLNGEKTSKAILNSEESYDL